MGVRSCRKVVKTEDAVFNYDGESGTKFHCQEKWWKQVV